jgi:hypothetical protein
MVLKIIQKLNMAHKKFNFLYWVTGKTFLIHKLQKLFGNSCVTIAFTAKAASLISGTTIHAKMRLFGELSNLRSLTGDN